MITPESDGPACDTDKRICFMPATLRLTGSGVNAVGGEGALRGEIFRRLASLALKG